MKKPHLIGAFDVIRFTFFTDQAVINLTISIALADTIKLVLLDLAVNCGVQYFPTVLDKVAEQSCLQ